jgi:hypothetical protein
MTIIDANSGEHNGLVTPGSMGTIKGTLLAYDPEWVFYSKKPLHQEQGFSIFRVD